MDNMNATKLVLLSIAAATLGGCGGISAEPIKARSDYQVNVTTPDAEPSASSATAATDEPYACHIIVIPPDDHEHTPINFVPTSPRDGDADAVVCNVGTASCNLIKDLGHAATDTVTGQSTGTLDLELSCSSLCSTGTDCPAPLSGTAEPACVVTPARPQGLCYLACDHGEACADGFTCGDKRSDPNIARKICLQAETVDYSFTYPVGGAVAGGGAAGE
jgi:hypothetical protein